MTHDLLRTIDHVCDSFEEAWKTGNEPAIDEYLELADFAGAAPQRTRLLRELVIVDLEHRWRRALDGSRDTPVIANEDTETSQDVIASPDRLLLEDYAREFPQFGKVEDLPDDMIAGEYKARWLAGNRPSHDEYGDRFPRRRPDLAEMLRGIDRELALDAALNQRADEAHGLGSKEAGAPTIHCPHCHNRMALPEDNPGHGIVCPGCGSHFSLVSEETTAFDHGSTRSIILT